MLFQKGARIFGIEHKSDRDGQEQEPSGSNGSVPSLRSKNVHNQTDCVPLPKNICEPADFIGHGAGNFPRFPFAPGNPPRLEGGMLDILLFYDPLCRTCRGSQFSKGLRPSQPLVVTLPYSSTRTAHGVSLQAQRSWARGVHSAFLTIIRVCILNSGTRFVCNKRRSLASKVRHVP